MSHVAPETQIEIKSLITIYHVGGTIADVKSINHQTDRNAKVNLMANWQSRKCRCAACDKSVEMWKWDGRYGTHIACGWIYSKQSHFSGDEKCLTGAPTIISVGNHQQRNQLSNFDLGLTSFLLLVMPFSPVPVNKSFGENNAAR